MLDGVATDLWAVRLIDHHRRVVELRENVAAFCGPTCALLRVCLGPELHLTPRFWRRWPGTRTRPAKLLPFAIGLPSDISDMSVRQRRPRIAAIPSSR